MRSRTSRGFWYGMALLASALLAGVSGGSGTHAAPSAQVAGDPAPMPLPGGPLPPGGVVGPVGGPYEPRGGLVATATPTPTLLNLSGPSAGNTAAGATIPLHPSGTGAGTVPMSGSAQSVYGPTGQMLPRSDTQPLNSGGVQAPFAGGIANPWGSGQQGPSPTPTATLRAPALPFGASAGPPQVLPSPIPTATDTPTPTNTPTPTATPTNTPTPTSTPTAMPSIRAPMNLRMVSSGPGPGVYTIAWDAGNVESVLEHRVYGLGAGGDRRLLFTMPGSASQALLYGMDPAIGYSLVLVAVDTLGRESPPSNVAHTGAAPTATPPTTAYGGSQPYGGAAAPPYGGAGAPPSVYGPGGSTYGSGAPAPPGGTTPPPSIYAPSGTAGAPIPPAQPSPYNGPVPSTQSSPYNAPIPPAQPSPYNGPVGPGPQTAPKPLR